MTGLKLLASHQSSLAVLGNPIYFSNHKAQELRGTDFHHAVSIYNDVSWAGKEQESGRELLVSYLLGSDTSRIRDGNEWGPKLTKFIWWILNLVNYMVGSCQKNFFNNKAKNKLSTNFFLQRPIPFCYEP